MSTNVLVCEKTHEAVRAVLPAPQVQTKLCFTYLAEGCAPTSVQKKVGIIEDIKILVETPRVD
eukprot:2707377-Heterocapsa_arctica.AAC.1